jgi:hypothetical protein
MSVTPWSRSCEMAESGTRTRKSVLQLLFLAVLMGIGYTCIRTLSFANEALNFLFVCVFFLIPFLAIRPMLRLHSWPKMVGLILLTPVLFLSSCSLMFTVACDGPHWSMTRIQPLQTIRMGSSTVQLQRYDSGGGVGIHGLNLEQRRLIVPGLFMVKSIDFFDAFEGNLSVEGPYRIRVQATESYGGSDHNVDRVYSLKPWGYF